MNSRGFPTTAGQAEERCRRIGFIDGQGGRYQLNRKTGRQRAAAGNSQRGRRTREREERIWRCQCRLGRSRRLPLGWIKYCVTGPELAIYGRPVHGPGSPGRRSGPSTPARFKFARHGDRAKKKCGEGAATGVCEDLNLGLPRGSERRASKGAPGIRRSWVAGSRRRHMRRRAGR